MLFPAGKRSGRVPENPTQGSGITDRVQPAWRKLLWGAAVTLPAERRVNITWASPISRCSHGEKGRKKTQESALPLHGLSWAVNPPLRFRKQKLKALVAFLLFPVTAKHLLGAKQHDHSLKRRPSQEQINSTRVRSLSNWKNPLTWLRAFSGSWFHDRK